MQAGADTRLISAGEVSEHNNQEDLWIIVNGQVFDITVYQHEHPGGEKVFKKVAGTDATKQFLKNHKFSTLVCPRPAKAVLQSADRIFLGSFQR
jgi:cytochrome b involved in lipid metabolism